MHTELWCGKLTEREHTQDIGIIQFGGGDVEWIHWVRVRIIC